MATTAYPVRVKELRHVQPEDLKPHPENWRQHPERQRQYLRAALTEVGVADALLAYEDPEWGLTLIDGALRQQELRQPIPILVLDVTRDEARKVLATHDAITLLAEEDQAQLQALLEDTVFTHATLREERAETLDRIGGAETLPEQATEAFYKDNPHNTPDSSGVGLPHSPAGDGYVGSLTDSGSTPNIPGTMQAIKSVQLIVSEDDYFAMTGWLSFLGHEYGTETVRETTRVAVENAAKGAGWDGNP